MLSSDCRANRPHLGLCFSIEMTTDELAMRMISSVTEEYEDENYPGVGNPRRSKVSMYKIANGFDSDDDFEEGGAPTMPSLQSLFGALGNPDMANAFQDPEAMDAIPDTTETEEPETKTGTRRHRKNGDKGKNKKRRFLGLYCTDLTARARNGELDNIIGREQEIDRAIQILCRRSKNNPCLIGEPGVGKTAIAEGLAERIANGEVPAKLADKEIHLLDLTALVAGTQFRGQFESRVKGLIDEIHNLVGAGDAEGNIICSSYTDIFAVSWTC